MITLQAPLGRYCIMKGLQDKHLAKLNDSIILNAQITITGVREWHLMGAK